MTNKFKTILTIATLTLCSIAQATENISILWGFNIGSNQATTLRHIAEDANKSQSKYNFIIESKPGAGGSIAANHVLQNPNNTLVGMSSSFFIRPAVETTGVHDLGKFKPILVQATGAPLAIVSKKHKNITDLLKQENASIGISGIGSLSDMLASALKEKNPNLNVVNFKGMVDASVAAAGGHIDAAVTFLIDSKSIIDSKEVTVIGYTGLKELDEYKGLVLVKQGITGLERLTANYAIFASNEMPLEKYKEIHNILSKAAKSEKALESYSKDMLTPLNVPVDKSQSWYDSERQYWKSAASKLIK